MLRTIRCLAVTGLIASLAVLLVLEGSSQTIWGGPQGDAKATGSLTVKIKPKAAKQEGARWRVDGGAWQKSGRTVSDLSVGQHAVTFKTIADWDSPNQKNPSIAADQTATVSGKYVLSDADTVTILLPGDVPLELVWIPAGSFMMGRYENEQDSTPFEKPQHQVTFANGFWLGKYEVTQAQWVAVMGNNPSYFNEYRGFSDRNPVETVSWNTIQTFITAVNALGQGTVRLPTEAEWEYACRAGTTTRFYWGDDPNYTQIDSCAWSNTGSDATHPVGQKLPNAWGLYDMSGNVYESCEDWYHSSYEGAPTDGSAWNLPVATNRVSRGGSSHGGIYSQGTGRSAHRGFYNPFSAHETLGFRIAM